MVKYYLKLSDSVCQFLNISAIEDGGLSHLLPASSINVPSIGGVNTFCIDKDLKSPLSLTISKRRSIIPCKLDHKLEFNQEILIPEPIIALEQFGRNIVCADSQSYKIISRNGQTQRILPLFPYDKNNLSPIMVAINEDEFLLITWYKSSFNSALLKIKD